MGRCLLFVRQPCGRGGRIVERAGGDVNLRTARADQDTGNMVPRRGLVAPSFNVQQRRALLDTKPGAKFADHISPGWAEYSNAGPSPSPVPPGRDSGFVYHPQYDVLSKARPIALGLRPVF